MKQSIFAAVIDIGSNSIRLMLSAVTPQRATAVERKRLITTRLAQGLDATGLLDEAAMSRSLDAIRTFADISREKLTQFLFAYATSAVRDAKNGGDFLARVLQETGIHVHVLSGPQEAHYAYIGATGRDGGGLIDIGGGSAQVMTASAAHSFPIGCVRVKERFGSLSSPHLDDTLAAWMDTLCAGLADIRQPRWTGVGGTITTLAALQAGLTVYDPAAVAAQCLTPQSVDALLRDLYAMGDGRANHPLLIDRHDVILYGGIVLKELMRRMEMQGLAVSDADGMEGYLMEQLKERWGSAPNPA